MDAASYNRIMDPYSGIGTYMSFQFAIERELLAYQVVIGVTKLYVKCTRDLGSGFWIQNMNFLNFLQIL